MFHPFSIQFKNPRKFSMAFRRFYSDHLNCRLLFLILTPLSLLAFLSSSSLPPLPLSTFPDPLRSLIIGTALHRPANSPLVHPPSQPPKAAVDRSAELRKSKMAVCLVGGARRFEVTGPSIVEMILKEYPNADLFLHSPLDRNSFKLSYFNSAPNKLAAVRIFEQKPISETESQLRVLTAANSPNGIQGLLQYFDLVEGCLRMIRSYQQRNNFTYDWIVRTRVDGYWNAPLRPENFITGKYVVPPGSSYGGLNDRIGVGDLNTSTVALSRLTLIPKLDAAGLNNLNSETAFKEQLSIGGVPFVEMRVPFCIVTERQYEFPPGEYGVPVAAMSSAGPLSGAKCRPCRAACEGECVGVAMGSLHKGWSWTEWRNGSMGLCDAHGEWEDGWEKIYEGVVGPKMAADSRRIGKMNMSECVENFSEMKSGSEVWEAPAVEYICRFGITIYN